MKSIGGGVGQCMESASRAQLLPSAQSRGMLREFLVSERHSVKVLADSLL